MPPEKSSYSPGPLCGVRAASVFLSITLLLAPLAQAITQLPAFSPSRDTWVDKGNQTVVNDGEAELVVRNEFNSSTGKFAFIKFKIAQSDIPNLATPTSAKLKLIRKSGATGGTISVYAANNNWGSALDWSPQPTIESIVLSSQPLATSTNIFDVTNYISGPGEYTFCIKYSNNSDVVFYSNDATSNKPQLILEVPLTESAPPNEYDRKIANVLDRGKEYRDRYIAVNGGTGSEADDDVHLIGYFDVTKHPYNAKGDALTTGTDDTLAIQRAVNEARDAQVAVYFPANKQFKVTATIECVQGVIDYQTNAKYPSDVAAGEDFFSTDYERSNHRDFPCILMGPVLPVGNASRPTLIVGTAATAFANANSPVPVLHFWSRGNTTGNVPSKNFPAASYNHLVRNLDFDLNNNPGAIGINMVGTQGTAIENLTIKANLAYAGISGLPGAGGLTSAVTIKGGRFGIDAFESPTDGLGITSVLNNCIIDYNGQASQENSVRWNHLGPLVLVGCTIKGASLQIDGPGDTEGMDGGNASRGNLSVVDSRIELIAPGPVIQGSRTPYLRNVYCKNATAVAVIETRYGDDVADSVPTTNGSQPWFLVKEYGKGAWLDHYPAGSDAPMPTPRYVNGVPQSTANNIVATYGGIYSAPPAGLLDRHVWPTAPAWDASDVINVKEGPYFAQGNNFTNDRQAIQDAITAAAATGKKVFIPAGHYRLNNSLTLQSDTVLFGLHRSLSVLTANDHPDWNGDGVWQSGTETTIFDTGGPATGTPLVKTVSSATGTTRLADLMLMQHMTANDTYLLDWQVGQDSVVQNVNFDRRTVNKSKFGGVVNNMNIPLISITGHGGGRWFSMNHQSGGNVSSAYRNIKVAPDTSPQALKFYMFNPEIDSQDIYTAEFVNCENLDVFGSKAEGKESPFIHISGGSDIRWIGLGGNAYCDARPNLNDPLSGEAVFEIVDSDNFVLSSCSFHIVSGLTRDPLTFNRLKETIGTTLKTTPGDKGFISYRRGATVTTGTAGINDTN